MRALFFEAEPFLPEPAGRSEYLERILDFVDAAIGIEPQEVLHAFFGTRLDPATLRVSGLHHVAVYIGDYRDEGEVEEWLDLLRGSAVLTHLTQGPSHIAPRVHGTPGWWVNAHAPAGELELFTCRYYGPWAAVPTRSKVERMSHVGLAVSEPGQVRPLLEFGTSFPGIDLLAFAPQDEIGHTYGHLVHRGTGQVLEVVYSATQLPGDRT